MGILRKAIFLVFTVAYLVIAPLTVLYALGYIFSPSHSKLLLTGLISLNSHPSQAQVELNHRVLKDTTPVVIRNLKSGFYNLHLSLPGMHPWQKQVEVKADKVLSFENILLFPTQFDSEKLTDFPITKIWHAAQTRKLVVLQGDHVSGLYLFEPERNQLEPIFPNFSGEYDFPVGEVLMHPLGEKAVAFMKQKEGIRPFLVKFLSPMELTPLAGSLQEPFDKFRWGPSQKNALFYLQGDTLKKMDFEERFPLFDVQGGIRGYTTDRRKLFVMDARRRLFELTEKGEIRKTLLGTAAKAHLIFGPDEGERYSFYFLSRPFIFTPLHEAFALFLSDQGKLFSNRLPYYLDKRVEEVVTAVFNRRAVYRKDSELWLVDFEREPEKEFFQTGVSPRKIYQGEQKISNLTWFYNDNYLLFVEGGWVKVLDFEGNGQAVPLFQISKRVPQIALDERRGFVYFADPLTRRLSRIQLFEPANILPRLVDDWVSASAASKDSP